MATTTRKRGAGRTRSSVEEDVGRRLRARREEHGLSLRELARRLGISPSAISQIETGKSRPSVSTLYAIVSELGMSLDELFAGRAARGGRPVEADADRNGGVASGGGADGFRVQRAAGRTAIDLESGVRWERLTPNPDPIDFLYVVYDVGGSSSRTDQFIRHEGREYGIVLSGSLEVTVGFDTHLLEAGDSICFDSVMPHRLRNVGDAPATGIWFVTGRQSDERHAALARASASAAAAEPV